MDRRGRGLSSEEAGPYELAREAEDIRAVVDAIGEPVLVLSHSYGGLCSLEAAVGCDGVARLLVFQPPVETDAMPLLPPRALAAVGGGPPPGDPGGAVH